MKNIIYGTGKAGKDLYNYFKKHNVKVFGFSDSEKRGFFCDLHIIPPENLTKDCKVYIASDWANEIAQKLVSLGISNFEDYTSITEHFFQDAFFDKNVFFENLEEINFILSLLSDNESKEIYKSVLLYRLTRNPLVLIKSTYPQYFHKEVKVSFRDTVYDCGAYTGDTAKLFHSYYKHRPIKDIIAIEPNKKNFETLKSNCPWAKCLNVALSDYDGSTNINDNGINASIDKKGQKVDSKRFDSLFMQDFPKHAIIKVDVEGSEMNLLKGAALTIKYKKPKLMISIYHKLSDLWQIPLFIHALNPKYKFYIGHHTGSLTDTVLYCV